MELPAIAVLPVGHGVHEVAPVVVMNSLAGHRVQEAAPAAAENCPTGHSEHVAAPAAENFPAGH